MQGHLPNISWVPNRFSFSSALVVVFALFAVMAASIMLKLLNEHDQIMATSNAISAAKTTSDNINNFRSFYSGEIVQPALESGVTVTHLFRETPNSIPLPATMSLDFGNYLTLQESSVGYKMFSNFPFKWRQDRTLDEVEFEVLNNGLNEEKVVFEENGDLRLFSPVVMESNCVSCHNSLEYSPKRDWVVGDVRGYQEIIYPSQLVSGNEARTPIMDRFILFVLLSFLAGLSVILVLAQLNNRAFRRVKDSARREQENAGKLELSNRALVESLEQLQNSKENEKLLSLVAEKTDNAVIITDSDGKIEWVNAGFENMTGYLIDEVKNREPGSFLQGSRTDPKTVKTMREAISNCSSFSVEVLNYSKSGKQYWVAIDSQPVLNEDGSLSAFIAIERDISAEKQEQQNLEAARRAAEESNEMKSQFVAMMSHEIRTPINGLLGALGLIKDSDLNEDQEKYMELAKSCADSLLFLVNDVLDYSKIEAGKLEIESTTFSLDEMLNSVSDVVTPRAQDQGLQLTFANGIPLDTYFEGDVSRIRQVLLNLLSNSLKFTEKGSVDLEVKPLTNNAVNRVLKFIVRDTGEGIAKKDHDRLFEKFVTLKPVYLQSHVGTGLGLSISKSLVELMGGEIGFSSEPGLGTEFWFTVPLVESSKCLPNTLSSCENENLSDLKGRILLAEDNPANQLVAKEILTRAGLDVEIVSDGADAILSCERREYDLILMDIGMPVVDGIEATKLIRKTDTSNSRTPIIAMTAHVKKGDRESLMDQGLSDYLAKPVSKQNLLKMVNKWLQLGREVSLVQETDIDFENRMPIEPLVDTEKLDIIRQDIGADLLKTLVVMFEEQVSELGQNIEFAINANELINASNFAHKLKGSASTLALSYLARILQEFEDHCREGKDNDLQARARSIFKIARDSHAELEKNVSYPAH